MADVNPNQDLRFKEIMKRVIPGAYFFSYIFIVWKLVTTKPICFLQQLSNVTNNVNDGVEVALWLLVTYIGGFVINSMASFWERNLCYRLFNRPSKKVLTFGGKDEIEGADNIIKDSKVCLSFRSINNDESRRILRFVKNHIARKDNLVEEMYHQSIMARNLCMSHFLAMFISYFFVPNLLASSTYVSVYLSFVDILERMETQEFGICEEYIC